MGRDYEGGGQVNLLNREVPADIYTHVANLVEAKILEDLEGSDTLPADREMAELLRGQVKRKIVKQTVMTTVYGVTFIGRSPSKISNRRGTGPDPATAARLRGAGEREAVPTGGHLPHPQDHGRGGGPLFAGTQDQEVAD